MIKVMSQRIVDGQHPHSNQLIKEDINISEYNGAISRLAARLARQAHACRAFRLDAEEIKQEIVYAFVIASQRFDESQGVPFLPYALRGSKQHVRRLINQEVKRNSIVGMSLDDSYEDEERGSNHDRVSTRDNIPEQILQGKQTCLELDRRLSPLTRKYVGLLDAPPVELYEELEALRARYIFANTKGIKANKPHKITPIMVAKLMGLDGVTRRKIARELRDVGKQIVG